MKKFISIAIALLVTTAAFGQNNSFLRQRMELAQVENDEGDTELEVFQMADNGQYYLSVGHLGIGDDVIQFQFDPVFELFIPLGSTLTEAVATMEQLKDFYKNAPGTSMETNGCLCAAFPNDQWETVTVTSRKLILSRLLEFSVERDDFIRATHVARSDFNALVSSLKFYQKIHPNEK